MYLEQQKELVEKAKNDAIAFGEIYEQFYQQIFGYILRRTANVEITEDITSEVFFKALKNIKQFTWRGVPFSSWLYRIASNEISIYYKSCDNYHRFTSKSNLINSDLNLAIDTELIEAETEITQLSDFLSLHESIMRLPEKYQVVITLKYFENKKIKEISEIIRKREGTVKSLLYRGLNKLRELIE